MMTNSHHQLSHRGMNGSPCIQEVLFFSSSTFSGLAGHHLLALHQLPASNPPPQNESDSDCVNLGEGAGLLCGGDGTVTQEHSLDWGRQQKLLLLVTFP